MATNASQRLYTTKQASEIIGRSKGTILRWISNGFTDVKYRDDNDSRIWTEEDILRFINKKNDMNANRKIRKRKDKE